MALRSTYMADSKLYLQNSPWRYSDRPNRIVVGKFLLQQGADPRRVLETFFDRIKSRECYKNKLCLTISALEILDILKIIKFYSNF